MRRQNHQGHSLCSSLNLSLNLSLSVVVLLSSCATSQTITPQIVGARDVSRGSGVPEIVRIVDLGALSLPKSGTFRIKPGDGKAVIGELLLLWGKDFGKQPSIAIGSEPTEVLAHVKGGGVVVRVPRGIQAGKVKVSVTTRGGTSSVPYPVYRVGLAAGSDGVQVFTVAKAGAITVAGRVALTAVQGLEVATDGSVAYALKSAGKGRGLVMHTIDLTRWPPVVVNDDGLPGKKLIGIARAGRSNLLAIVTDTHIVYVDTQVATLPALYKALPLPRTVVERPLTGVALSPDGRTLALLAQDKNELLLFDASRRTTLPVPQVKTVLPDARLPRVQHASFSLDGKKLWVIAGDTAASMAAGHQAVDVVVYTLAEGRIDKEAGRWTLDQAGAPAGAAMARSAPTPAGTAIRTAIASSALYVTVQPPTLLSKSRAPGGGSLLRAVDKGTITRLLGGRHLLGAVSVTGRPQVIVALGARERGGKLDRILVSQLAWDKPAKSVVTPLGPLGRLGVPPQLGLLVVQP